MASLTKINSFVAGLANKVFNLGTDQLKIALTDTAHNVGWTQLSQLTQVSYAGLTTGTNPLVTTTSSTQTLGVYKLVVQSTTVTANAAVGPFRYIYLFDDTATNKDLICYYDYGSEVTMANTDTFTFTFDGTNGVFQLS